MKSPTCHHFDSSSLLPQLPPALLRQGCRPGVLPAARLQAGTSTAQHFVPVSLPFLTMNGFGVAENRFQTCTHY